MARQVREFLQGRQVVGDNTPGFMGLNWFPLQAFVFILPKIWMSWGRPSERGDEVLLLSLHNAISRIRAFAGSISSSDGLRTFGLIIT